MIEMTPEAKRRALRAAELSRTRHTGMDRSAREALNLRLQGLTDWWGVCRKCGERLEGALTTLKEHSCGQSD